MAGAAAAVLVLGLAALVPQLHLARRVRRHVQRPAGDLHHAVLERPEPPAPLVLPAAGHVSLFRHDGRDVRLHRLRGPEEHGPRVADAGQGNVARLPAEPASRAGGEAAAGAEALRGSYGIGAGLAGHVGLEGRRDEEDLAVVEELSLEGNIARSPPSERLGPRREAARAETLGGAAAHGVGAGLAGQIGLEGGRHEQHLAVVDSFGIERHRAGRAPGHDADPAGEGAPGAVALRRAAAGDVEGGEVGQVGFDGFGGGGGDVGGRVVAGVVHGDAWGHDDLVDVSFARNLYLVAAKEGNEGGVEQGMQVDGRV